MTVNKQNVVKTGSRLKVETHAKAWWPAGVVGPRAGRLPGSRRGPPTVQWLCRSESWWCRSTVARPPGRCCTGRTPPGRPASAVERETPTGRKPSATVPAWAGQQLRTAEVARLIPRIPGIVLCGSSQRLLRFSTAVLYSGSPSSQQSTRWCRAPWGALGTLSCPEVWVRLLMSACGLFKAGPLNPASARRQTGEAWGSDFGMSWEAAQQWIRLTVVAKWVLGEIFSISAWKETPPKIE